MKLAPHSVTLRQLQYVVAVAERSSFRQAAKDCHVAQPSLSAQIAALEGSLGIKLFERDKHGVRLTRAGSALVGRCRALLLATDELVDTARVLADPFAGSLTIGVIPTMAPYLLPEMAPRLRKAYPNLTFQWVEDKTENLLARMERSEIDAALLAKDSDLVHLSSVELGKDPFVIAIHPDHALAKSNKTVRLASLEGEHVFFLDDGHCFRDQALAICTQAGAEEASFRATSLATLIQMVAGGHGLTLLPKLALRVENRHQTLCVRSFGARGPGRTIALMWRAGAVLGEPLTAVGQTLKAEYQAIQAATT